MHNRFTWIRLINPEFSFGFVNLGEWNEGAEKGNIVISRGKNPYIDLGSTSFNSITANNFFVQSQDGNFICCEWMFQKGHGQLAPVIFNLQDETYFIPDTTRSLQVNKILLLYHLEFTNGLTVN